MCAASSLPFAWHYQQPQLWRLASIYAGYAITAQTTTTEIWVQKQWQLCAAIRHRPSSVVISQIIVIDAYLHTCWLLCSCGKPNDISFAVAYVMLHTKQGYIWSSNTINGYSVVRKPHDLVLWTHKHIGDRLPVQEDAQMFWYPFNFCTLLYCLCCKNIVIAFPILLS